MEGEIVEGKTVDMLGWKRRSQKVREATLDSVRLAKGKELQYTKDGWAKQLASEHWLRPGLVIQPQAPGGNESTSQMLGAFMMADKLSVYQ